MMNVSLRLTAANYTQLHAHLFPTDGKEAVAIALCGQYFAPNHHTLVVREIHLIPYEVCLIREPDRVRWPTEVLIPLLERANRSGWSVVKIHGHQAEWPWFSYTDDVADKQLFPSVAGWIEADVPHASVILLNDGRMLGRWTTGSSPLHSLDRIIVVGDNVSIHSASDFHRQQPTAVLSNFNRKNALAFGQRTVEMLNDLSIAVIGCSGTGSPTIEMLARLGVGRLVLVDPDIVEEKNLNRIIHTTIQDVLTHRHKVHVLAEAVKAIGLGTKVEAYPYNLFKPEVVRAVAGCDVVFGCMDGVEGRFLLNKLATFYVLPYFDLGVKLEADGDGAINQVSGAVHYLQPGQSSLISRGVFTMKGVEAEGVYRHNPLDYERRRREGYIKGVQEDRPAVISVNMLVASMGVNDLLARIHDYRTDGNAGFAQWRISLSHVEFYPEPESAPCSILRNHVGRGDVDPLLDNPELSE